MSQNTIIIAGSIFAVVYLVSFIAYLAFRQYMRFREKELQLEHARLDDFRAHMERQLMELNAKFASSEGRWREINHLVIAGQNKKDDLSEKKSGVTSSEFLRSHGIKTEDMKIQDDLIFVLTPFHDDLRDDFEAIAKVGRDLGFTVNRGDEKASHGDIFSQLLRQIVKAKIIVANISGRNPNVFYELGIAHALDKPVILLSHSEKDVPFDVQSKRIVFYGSPEDLHSGLLKMLSRVLSAHST